VKGSDLLKVYTYALILNYHRHNDSRNFFSSLKSKQRRIAWNNTQHFLSKAANSLYGKAAF
jgi:predicted LPLAT superfamily acyltransferase